MYIPPPPPVNANLDDVIQWAFNEFKQLSEEIEKLEQRLTELDGEI